MNGRGDLVGGNINRPRKCPGCSTRAVRIAPGERLSVTCRKCGRDFSYLRGDSLQGRKRTNCQDCVRGAKKPPRQCKQCGAETKNSLTAFCSEDCRASARQVQRSKTGRHPCPECGASCIGRVCRKCFRKEQQSSSVRREDSRPAFASLPEALTTGRIGESYFDLIAATQGWRVFAPSGDCTPGVDRILAIGGRCLSIQIKTTKEMTSQSYYITGNGCDADVVCLISLESADMWMIEIPKGQRAISVDEAKPWNFCTGVIGEMRTI